jgi:hypothetical protein
MARLQFINDTAGGDANSSPVLLSPSHQAFRELADVVASVNEGLAQLNCLREVVVHGTVGFSGIYVHDTIGVSSLNSPV